ncbi:DUF4905 domain-containing protein [Pontibacter qinzhouensis]|uniref:DUF4905 domain-containing protein n=1 Tax=Pontibacter qinzhouensis TaxID=2603253 RepID=A0A5C8K305_9BACT|nr:DUF4905 domain-containing protein [Pontibacter qinzhouensis]TXK44289.1 DUF4905 domain-containing protein [Pontibacter qinzhouensis]
MSLRFKYDFGAALWRLKLDTATGNLALEVRDGDLLLTSFWVLNCQTLALQELQLPRPNTWWYGLEEAHGGFVWLHGYGDRKLGQHKGITAMATNGQVLWEQPELAFYGVGQRGLYAHEVQQPGTGLRLLEIASGKETHQGISQAEAAEQVHLFNTLRFENCQYPVLYLEGETYFNEVAAFLQATQAIEAVKAIEYLDTASHILVSCYRQSSEGKLDNYLFIFDLEGNLCYSECLASELSGIGSDTFFIFRGDLYFIQKKEILQIHSLLV